MPKRSREEPSQGKVLSTPGQNVADLELDGGDRSVKYVQTAIRHQHPAMKCSLPPHPDVLSFNTIEEFEIHYAKVHVNRCAECKRHFPSDHFLDLHIRENHDPLIEARKARAEKTYICFLEDCDRVCSSREKRRMHLVDKHSFPRNYDFLIVDSGLDQRRSMLRRHGNSSTATQSNTLASYQDSEDAEESKQIDLISDETPFNSSKVQPATNVDQDANEAMNKLTSSMSALKFVPPSVRFGRGGRRGGFSRS